MEKLAVGDFRVDPIVYWEDPRSAENPLTRGCPLIDARSGNVNEDRDLAPALAAAGTSTTIKRDLRMASKMHVLHSFMISRIVAG
jgi:hypothetical protein